MRPRQSPLVACLFLSLAGVPATGQTSLADEAYLEPPSLVREAVLAPWHENTSLTGQSPDGTAFLVRRGDGMPTLAMMARPWVNLGETEFDPVARRSRRLTTRSDMGLDVFFPADGRTVSVRLPRNARVGSAVWSPDGSQLAFFAHFPDSTQVYVADPQTGNSRAVTRTPVLATLVTSFQWTADGKSLLLVLTTAKVEGWPADPFAVAGEPRVRLSRPGKTPSRTYRFLMQSPEDQELFRQLTTGQLTLVDVADGKELKVGAPAMIQSVDLSPDSSWFRVTTVQEPFSYYVPSRSFGTRQELWNLRGEVVQTLAERELREVPNQGGPPGRGNQDEEKDGPPKRSLQWRPDGAGLSFLQLEPVPEKKEEDEPAAQDGDAPKDPPDDPPKDPPDDPVDDDDANQDDDGMDEGDEEKEKPRKDRVMLWKPPFDDEDVEVVYESEQPLTRVQYSEDAQTLFLSTTEDERAHIHAVRLSDPETRLLIFRGKPGQGSPGGFNRGRLPPGVVVNAPRPGPTRGAGQDGSRRRGGKDDKKKEEEPTRGATRGSLMTRPGPAGVSVVRMTADGAIYFSGSEDPADQDNDPKDPKVSDAPKADKELGPPVPYLDQVMLESGEVTPVWQGSGKTLERMTGVQGDPITTLYTTREWMDVVADAWRVELSEQSEVQLTHNTDFTPWYHDRVTDRFEVERVDGFRFWVRVTRDADFGERLPAMFWFYPREYADQDSYDQGAVRSGRPRFNFERPSTRAMSHLIRMGYVVVEPDLPIVGPDGRMNDNFQADLRNGLYAVINELDKRRLIDRDRLAIGGHSYGAFGTANALAHTPFFRAGIAGDGCFNRTLTPMAFQSERRYLWDARETYVAMSPLLWANQVNGALLMYHGEEDANTGTFPINSERMYQALDGLGKPCSLYMYPYEAHGPAARETTLDLWARWIEWLDIWVKHPEKGDELLRQKEDEKEEPAASNGRGR